MANLRKYTVLLTAETQDALRGLDAVKDAMAGLHRVTMRMGRAIAGMVQETADYGDEMSIAAAKANVNTQQWMKLVHAADIAGVKQHHLMTFFRRMGDNAQDAAGGTGMAVDELTNLFGSLDKMPKGQFELFEAIIGPIGELLNGTDEQMRRAGGMMSSIGGRSGGLIAPLLKLGLGNLRALMKEAEEFGLVLDPDITDATQKWNDEVIRVKRSFEGIRNTVGARLLPQVTKIATMTQAWVREQRALIEAGLAPWLKMVEVGLAGAHHFMDRFRRGFEQFAAPLKFVVKGLSTLSMVVAIGGTLLTGFATLGASLIILKGVVWALKAAWAALSVIFAPYVGTALLITAAVAALYLVFEDIITLLRGGESVIGSFLDKLGVLEEFNALLEAFRDFWTAGMNSPLLDQLSQFGGMLRDSVLPVLKDLMTLLTVYARLKWGAPLKSMLSGATEFVGGLAEEQRKVNASNRRMAPTAGTIFRPRAQPSDFLQLTAGERGMRAMQPISIGNPRPGQAAGGQLSNTTTVNFTNNAIPAEQLGPVIQSQVNALAANNMNREGG